METPDLTSARFWEGEENHIATGPLRSCDADGLAAFAAEQLKARSWCFFQTSGSEGLPRWVGLEKEAFLISAREVNAFFAVTPADHWLLALPLHHVGGFSIHARCFAAGSSVHRMADEWSAERFTALCREHRATLASLVPTQVFDLVNGRHAAPPHLRAVIVGGGALAHTLREQAVALGWPLYGSYGMTETASQIATQAADEYAMTAPDALEVLPHWKLSTTADGVLTVRGQALAKGYASRDAAGGWSWQAVDPAAGLQTRDRVRLWQHGTRSYLEFLGRDSSFIKVCGELVNRDALQKRLDESAASIGLATGAVIVPTADPRRETALLIAVEAGATTPSSRDALLQCYNSNCLPFERAAGIREVSALPRSPLGKVRVAELSALLGRGSPASRENRGH